MNNIPQLCLLRRLNVHGHCSLQDILCVQHQNIQYNAELIYEDIVLSNIEEKFYSYKPADIARLQVARQLA